MKGDCTTGSELDTQLGFETSTGNILQGHQKKSSIFGQ
jgi:hypothetical protein